MAVTEEGGRTFPEPTIGERTGSGGIRHLIPGRKVRPKRKFSGWISNGRPGVIRADVQGQKLRSGP